MISLIVYLGCPTPYLAAKPAAGMSPAYATAITTPWATRSFDGVGAGPASASAVFILTLVGDELQVW